MRRYLFILCAIFLLVLAGCGKYKIVKDDGSDGKKEQQSEEVVEREVVDRKVNKVVDEETDVEKETVKREKREKTGSESTDYDEVLLDSKNVSVTLLDITRVEEEYFDEEYYEIRLAVENKLDKTIVIQADEVSADDYMIDEMVWYYEVISGGKKSNTNMEIRNYRGDLPSLEDNLEFKLVAYLDDSYDTLEEAFIRIDIK